MKRMMIILITFAVLVLSAKVIYQFEPEKPHLLKPKTMKSKSAEFFQTHKENYMRYLDEKTDLNYVTAQKVDTKGDTIRYFNDNLHNNRINIKKLDELRKLGLTNYTDEELKWRGDGISVRKDRISMSTLAYAILSRNTIFIGTVQKIEPVPYYDTAFIQTKVTVKVDEYLRGEYYYDPIPEQFIIYCDYDQKIMTKEKRKLYENREVRGKVFDLGRKYIFFRDSYISEGVPIEDLNNINVFENHEARIYLIENNKIMDKDWEEQILLEEFYKTDRGYKKHTDLKKLKDYIKLLEKTNETEKFFDIDFK
ncbi:MAG: hypothetical protein RBS89_08590 [Candidatus Delongbacteria bacterium]|jgi:hypothetical protein|nr:hypothetical protein [Candidatus Delongbacteria bacterium]